MSIFNIFKKLISKDYSNYERPVVIGYPRTGFYTFDFNNYRDSNFKKILNLAKQKILGQKLINLIFILLKRLFLFWKKIFLKIK